jgi:hypothetical protein
MNSGLKHGSSRLLVVLEGSYLRNPNDPTISDGYRQTDDP